MDYKDLAKKWFEKGNNDLIAGEYILSMPNPPTDTVCFHSQQAVEKYLKGFLAFHRRETPKIHDLEELLSNCEEIDSEFDELYDLAMELSSYAVEVRYPMEADHEITKEEAHRGIKIARDFKDFILKKLKLS